MSALRKIHSGLAHLFAILLPIQFFLAGLGAFTTIHNKKFSDNNFGPHGALGSLLGLIAILILLLALAGRWLQSVWWESPDHRSEAGPRQAKARRHEMQG